METTLTQLSAMVQTAFSRAYEHSVNILPQAILALGITVLGIIIAAIASALMHKALDFFAVDKLVGKTPLDKFLKELGIRKGISEILSFLVFWLVILITLVFAAELLHLDQVSRILSVITRFVPQIIAAIFIVIFGMLLAKFLQTIITQAVASAQIGYEGIIGKVVYLLVLLFVFLAAFEQIGFRLSVITTNVLVLLSTGALIVGIALAIGLRSMLENALACRHLRTVLSVGAHIKIADTEGTLHSFTHTDVVLEHGGKKVSIPASFFSRHIYTVS